MTPQEFIAWERASKDTIDVKRCYIDLAGDLVAGVLLSQIVFWHLPDERGRQRLRVEKGGIFWIVKERTDWWAECRLSPKQYDRAADLLRGKELIETTVGRFNGIVKVHIRLVWEKFLPELLRIIEDTDAGFPQRSKPEGQFPKSQNRDRPNGDSGITQTATPLTETLAENTNTDLKTFNVADGGFKYSSSRARDEAILAILQLTGDERSKKRFEQLWSIADQSGQLECWENAYKAVEARLKKATMPIERPGAYFQTVVTALLNGEGVAVPTGNPDERADIRARILGSLPEEDQLPTLGL